MSSGDLHTSGEEKEYSSLDTLQKLEETHDLSYWKDLDEQTKDKIKEDIATGSFRDKGLQTLILNYVNDVSPPNVRYIYGTQTVTSCVLHEKKIYFFGDVHKPYISEDIKCPSQSTMNIASYLEKVFSTTQVPIDFYIEMFIPKNRLGYQRKDRDIVRLRNLVRDCVIVDKKECSYPAVRSHYVDLRQDPDYPFIGQSSQSVPPYKFAHLIAYLKHDYNKVKNLGFNFSRLKKSLSKVATRYKGTITRMAEKQMKRMEGQLVDGDPNINRSYNTIMAYAQRPDLQLSEQDLKLVLHVMYKNILSLPELQTDKILFDLIQKFCLILFRFFSIAIGDVYLDIYTVSRVCRVFNRVSHKFSGPPRNIVIFAGDAHVRNLLDIFLSLGARNITTYKSVEDVDVNSVKCTEGLPVPLFERF